MTLSVMEGNIGTYIDVPCDVLTYDSVLLISWLNVCLKLCFLK